MKNSRQFMNTATQWSSQIQQSNRSKLNKKYSSWVVTQKYAFIKFLQFKYYLHCHVTHPNITNQHTTQKKSHKTCPLCTETT